MTGSGTGFGLYVHWPFCASKCPYCDFNSHVSDRIDQSRWTTAYLDEIDRVAAETSDRVLSTVFFGGGTPSLMESELVAALIERVRARWRCTNDLEVTLEANPGSVEAHRFAGYRAAGVNRVSLGIQALNDADLRRLGRLHSVAEALAALDTARAAFDRVSFDLIYARQDQTVADWEAELTRALRFAPEHLSLYQLTIEDGTAFGDRHARGLLRGLPDEDRGADLYAVTQDICGSAGLPAYEISNHARPGAECRHNLIYWRTGDFAGIGPGAHGRVTLDGRRMETVALRAPDAWLQAVSERGSGEAARTALSDADVLQECLLMGLRLREGIGGDRLERLPGFQDISSNINELIASGLLTHADSAICTTERGRSLLDAVLREIFR